MEIPQAPALMTVKQKGILYAMTLRIIDEEFPEFSPHRNYGDQLQDLRTDSVVFWEPMTDVFNKYYTLKDFNLFEYFVRQSIQEADDDCPRTVLTSDFIIDPVLKYDVHTDVSLFYYLLVDMMFYVYDTTEYIDGYCCKAGWGVVELQAMWRGHSVRWKYPSFTWPEKKHLQTLRPLTQEEEDALYARWEAWCDVVQNDPVFGIRKLYE
jgi:hypothetical protein